MIARTRRYVALVTAAAVVACGALALLADDPAPRLGTFVLLVVAIAVAERTEVTFRWDRTEAGFTLIEVALGAGLLLVPATHVVLAVLVAMALAHLTALRTPIKVAYNLAYATLGAALGGLVMTAVPAVGPLVAGRPVVGMIGAMLTYGVVSVLGFAGLLARLQDAHAARLLLHQLPMHAASTLGTTSVAVVLAALWVARPELVPFVIAPALAVHLAMRSSIRAAGLVVAQQAEHDRLGRVVDGASDGIVLLDADAVVQVWNPAMSRMTGRPTAAAVGRPVAELLGPSVRRGGRPAAGRWTLEDAREHTPVVEQDAELVDDGGTRRVVRESHAFTFDDRGRCTGAVVVVRDVSRQRELERLRSDFVSRVSHELRTPLTPIRGFASVLLRRGELLSDEQRADALTRIVERADHLHRLVEDLLLVTRLEGRDVEQLVDARPVDVGPVVRAAVDEAVASSGRTVAVALPSDLPPAHADDGRVRQILAGLLDNAVRYTDPDTPIEVEADRSGDDVRIRVVDHGPGIPSSERDTVFERFHRLEDPLTMRTGGVGIGLFLARRLAEAMHGSVDIVDTPVGAGTTVEVRLPVATAPPSPISEPPDEGTQARPGDIRYRP